MGVCFCDREGSGKFKRRLEKVRADDKPRFGKLGPAAVMRHLRYTVEMSLEEVEEKDISNIFTRTIGRWLFFHVITNWPKGVIKGPASLTPQPQGDLEAERAALFEAMDRYVAALEADPARVTLMPAFGRLTLAYWARAHGVHFEHHCKQYGV